MRDEALMPLTHDHHHALAAARRLAVAATGTNEERVLQARVFMDFFRTDTVEHFREEEETVFPLVADEAQAAESLQRVMLEHLRIHSAVGALQHEIDGDGPSPDTMKRLAGLLQDHIRYEEKVVFPMIEASVDPTELHAISLAPRAREGSGQTT